MLRDIAISVGVTIAVVALAPTIGLPVAAAWLVGGFLGSMAAFVTERLVSHTPITPRSLLAAAAIGLVSGALGAVGGSLLGGVAGRFLPTVAAREVSSLAAQSASAAGGILDGGSWYRSEPKHVSVASEPGIASRSKLEVWFRRRFGALDGLELTRKFPFVTYEPETFLTSRDLEAYFQLPVARTNEPQRPPPGTANVVIGIMRPTSFIPTEGRDFTDYYMVLLADAYRARLVTGDPEHDAAFTKKELARSLADVAKGSKIHDLVLVGHSGSVPSDSDAAECAGKKDRQSCLANLPDWHGLGVIVGSAGHRETLVPGFQAVLRSAAGERGVPVRDLFAPGATIELLDCQVGRNEEWLQDLSDFTGARVVAYKKNVSATVTIGKDHFYRGIDDGAVRPNPEDGRVVFMPGAAKSKGFLSVLK